MKGFSANVFRGNYGDCTNGGYSSTHNSIIIVGEGIPELWEVKDGETPFRLIKRTIGGTEYRHLEPLDKKGKWYMAGGNFAYSCDSRFSEIINQYPISIHDRTE